MAFLGTAGYYRKFVPQCSAVAKLLTDLTKKRQPVLVVWSPACEIAFQALKAALVSAPILVAPDYTKQFLVQTDASDYGISAVLSQVMASTEELTVDGSCAPQAGTSQVHSMPTALSPDSKCSICMERFNNVSHLDQCRHRFCFNCIQEWAKTKAECPLCKQPFRFNFHSIQADDEYKQYILNGTFARPDGNRFQYRSTFTSNYSIPVNPLTNSFPHTTFTPPDSRILFDGRSNQTFLQRGRDLHQMIQRLTSRRQASAEGRFMSEIQEEELINFRRALYYSGVRVRNIQGGGQYRDISAEFIRRNPASLHRLVPWLKRELIVLFGIHGSLINIVQHIIISNVTQYDMESQAFVEELRPFLKYCTDHFLHEFISFARCPYNVKEYDQHAIYDCLTPSYMEHSNYDCSAQSSIITISSDEEDVREADVPSFALGLGHIPWDNETPGTSYSTLEQATATAPTAMDSSESSDEEPSINRAIKQLDIKMHTAAKSQDRRSSPPASFTQDKCAFKASHKDSTSSDKHGYSKKKEKRKRPVISDSHVSSPDVREARKKRKLA
ncbi:E3 ubiquitin-protein ligase Topors-like [Ascaphus truei]|uniref:E3 ubiquitin-protein ligase Topors-like n=1 Tax=Ascaphus truei TaxID=8439 RepID=UPI003F5AA5FB